MRFRGFRMMGLLLVAVMPSLGIYHGCDQGPDFTELRHASQDFPYDLKASRAIALQGGWKDTLLVGDILDRHGQEMLDILVGFGVPEQNLSFTLGRWWGSVSGVGNLSLADLVSGAHESLREKTRVAHLPLFRPLADSADVKNVRDNAILFIVSAGNTYTISGYDGLSGSNNWDHWNPDHEIWRPEIFNPSDLTRSEAVYTSTLGLVRTGKVLFATSARVKDGSVEPYREVMRCGKMLQDACFTVLPEQFTSNAAARLAAMAFYLAQFWDTPEEIVGVLKACAVDIGAPGVDEEYGHGVATLLCAPVVEKEVDIILSYSSAPAARSVRNVLRALRGEPKFEEFVRAMFLQ